MTRRFRGSGPLRTLTLCAALLLGLPSTARANEGERVRVVVDVSKLGAEEASFVDAVSPGLRAAIEDAGYVLDDSVGAEATVRLRVRYFNEGNLDYQIDVDISAGEALTRLDTIACPQCFEADIVAKVDEKHAMILDGLERTLAKASKPAPASEPDPAVEPEAEPKPKPIGALGGAGIGVGVLGVGALVAGSVELGRGKIFDAPSQIETQRTFVDHRPVGGALLGVGAVVLAAGITMIVVDVVRANKQRKHTALAVPLLGPGLVGLGYTGQF